MESPSSSKNQALGIAGHIAHFFVWNGKLSLLMMVFIMLAGVLSFRWLPKQYNPEIVAPAFQIITVFPGADAKQVDVWVTQPLEEIISDIDGVEHLISESHEGGVSQMVVQFYVGEDLEQSKIKLNQQLSNYQSLRPLGVHDPFVKTIDPNDVPIMTLALSSTELDGIELRKWGEQLKDELKVITDTSNIEVVGGDQNQLQIEVDPIKLQALSVSPLNLMRAVQSTNQRVALKGLENNESIIPVELTGRIESKAQLEAVALWSTPEKNLTVNDVATVTEGPKDADAYTEWFSREFSGPVALVTVAKKRGSNSIQVSRAVQQKVATLQQSSFFPSNLQISILRDEGLTAKKEINRLVINLIQAILIVALVLFLFLDRRPAFIVAIVIPLTLAVVMGGGLLFGQTINRITLFALILSLGLLVDNATVVIENILRHLKNHPEIGVKTATVQAVDEVGMGLIMSTVTTVLAFVPMAFVTGMMGPYMGPIPFFVPLALIGSLGIAFSINPWLSSLLLKRTEPKAAAGSQKIHRYSQALIHYYQQQLRTLLHQPARQKKLMGIVFILFIVSMSLPAVGWVKFRMLPKADRDQFYIYLDLPEGVTVEKTRDRAEQISQMLLAQPAVRSVQSFTGTAPVIDFNGLFKGASGRIGSHQATLKVNLVEASEREKTSEQWVEIWRNSIGQAILEQEPDAHLKWIEDPPGPPVLSTLVAKVQGNDHNVVKAIVHDLEAQFQSTKGVVDIDTTLTPATQKIVMTIEQEKASIAGISSADITETLALFLQGQVVGIYHEPNAREQQTIQLQLAPEYRRHEADLSQISLQNSTGEWIPLSELVTVTHTERSESWYRDDQMATEYVTAEMSGRGVTYATIDLFRFLLSYQLPSGQGKITNRSLYGIHYRDQATQQEYQINWGGEWELTLNVFRDLGLAMMVAIALIYFVLVAQFHSFKTPLIIMGTIPLALIGVLPGFAVVGLFGNLYFNATSMIGVIALAGIVVNNAIILLEYLNALRQKGYTAEMALIEAGSTRMQPILLTTATTVLGSLTIIQDPVWSGLAWSIVWGLSVSALLTLFIFPILYFQIEGKTWAEAEREKPYQHSEAESHGPALS
ncbi:efflux RND transporter permease subunit [Candidatus Peregrinibacteria bacterium]|nr:MAG: efflux RND transporter permease subunit [Candidatus Peregrinibacteria bacterium]